MKSVGHYFNFIWATNQGRHLLEVDIYHLVAGGFEQGRRLLEGVFLHMRMM